MRKTRRVTVTASPAPHPSLCRRPVHSNFSPPLPSALAGQLVRSCSSSTACRARHEVSKRACRELHPPPLPPRPVHWRGVSPHLHPQRRAEGFHDACATQPDMDRNENQLEQVQLKLFHVARGCLYQTEDACSYYFMHAIAWCSYYFMHAVTFRTRHSLCTSSFISHVFVYFVSFFVSCAA